MARSLSWYINRLKGMSPDEVAWRISSKGRDVLDKYRFAFGLYPSYENIFEGREPESITPGFSVSDIKTGEWVSGSADAETKKWLERLTGKADRIVEHKLSFFDLKDHFLGDPIDWNRDHSSGRKSPMDYAQSIDYRDVDIAGDCKLVWEPSRHHQLVVLGRAYRATGEMRYAQAIVDQMTSWLDLCPFGYGMNWRSPMEISMRILSWVWAIDLIRDSGLFTGDFQKRVLHSVYLHLWDVTRKYSKGSSANNHLIGEAAGVYIATSYFSSLANADKWRKESREILISEVKAQTYPDGCNREHAFGYQLFVLQFFIFAGMVGRWRGEEYPDKYWSYIEKMLEFSGAVTEGGDRLPLVGDSDDGYVLDLGGSLYDIGQLLCFGAVMFNRSDFKKWAGGYHEAALWLLGEEGHDKFDTIALAGDENKLKSRAFNDSGYYLLQTGETGSDKNMSVLFDCAELGFKSIAGHGHADALSFSLRTFGVDVFVDPGTYDYFTYPKWRKYFRSTRAHNTIEVDNMDQSAMHGPFMWGERANARLLKWEPSDNGGVVSGEHDGYTRLSDPVMHKRTLELDGDSGRLEIIDEIVSDGEHDLAIYFHLSEMCVIEADNGNDIDISVNGKKMRLTIDNSLKVTILNGSEHPPGGWVSRGYHHKTVSATIVAQGRFSGGVLLKSCIAIS